MVTVSSNIFNFTFNKLQRYCQSHILKHGLVECTNDCKSLNSLSNLVFFGGTWFSLVLMCVLLPMKRYDIKVLWSCLYVSLVMFSPCFSPSSFSISTCSLHNRYYLVKPKLVLPSSNYILFDQCM